MQTSNPRCCFLLSLPLLALWACDGANGTPADARARDAVAEAAATDASSPDLALSDGGGAVPLPGLGAISGQCGELDDTEWNDTTIPFLFRNAIDFGAEGFDASKLSGGGKQILAEGNLNASSLHSEIMAYEVLYRCELAKLLKTETKITYIDPGGKKTDLLTEIDARKIGVSVTRAYHAPPTDPYTEEEAKTLLTKKLAALPLNLQNADPKDAWVRSILHVVAYDGKYADAIQSAWKQVDAATKGSAILILTVTDGADAFLYGS